MRGREFLETAVRLRDADGSASREADLRTAAGRSYYALFQTIIELLTASGVQLTSRGSDHEIALDALNRIRRTHAGDVADRIAAVRANLLSLKSWRSRADYELSPTYAGWTFNKSSIFQLTHTAKSSIAILDEQKMNLDQDAVRSAGEQAVQAIQIRNATRGT